MTGAPDRHTKTEGLKRLLRRRGRRHKVGANTGETVYSWAEYGPVNFTPSGDGSIRWLAMLAVCLVAFLLALYAGVILWAIGTMLFSDDLSISEKAIGLPVVTIILSGPLWLTGLIGWVYVRLDGNGKRDRERLIAAADTLRAKQAEAQDERANHAK